MLAIARRPGDWLVRWHPHTGRTQWHWLNDDRRLNGHAVQDAQERRLWTTETEQGTGRGLLGIRHSPSLEKTEEWDTHGADPHQVMALPEAIPGYPSGTLMVANGGITTFTETGRVKRYIDQMDSSLVALHPTTGELLGQWRLPDRYLSIRHLAWNPRTRQLGIALQAEHTDLEAQWTAPVLATWNGEALKVAIGQPPLKGYGGDVCAHPTKGFAVSCPRVHAVAVFCSEGNFVEALKFPQATGLAARGTQWWSTGGNSLIEVRGATPTVHTLWSAATKDLQVDNHFVHVG